MSPLLTTVGTVTAIRNALRPTVGATQRLVVQHFADRRIRRFDERRFTGDRNRFLDGADLELKSSVTNDCVPMVMPFRSKVL